MMTLTFTGALAAQRKIRTLRRIDVTEHAATPAAARVLLKDTDQNGTLLCDIRLSAEESKHLTFDPPLRFTSGLYVQVSAGTVRGSVTGE